VAQNTGKTERCATNKMSKGAEHFWVERAPHGRILLWTEADGYSADRGFRLDSRDFWPPRPPAANL